MIRYDPFYSAIKMVDILEQFESLSESDRASRIDMHGVSQALLATPPEEAIAWLARCLPSTVSSTWGLYLARCRPTIFQLGEWLARNGSHKIAALDAMRLLSEDPEYVLEAKEREAIADQLYQIKSNSPSPRVNDLLSRVRHNWKLAEPRDQLPIPETIRSLAQCLLSFRPVLVDKWCETIQAAYQPPKTSMEFWASLAQFASDHGAMAICDHREDPSSVIEKLSSIRYSKGILQIIRPAANNIDKLCKEIAMSLKSNDLYIASLDSGSDCYWLTINYRENLRILEDRLAAAVPDSLTVSIY